LSASKSSAIIEILLATGYVIYADRVEKKKEIPQKIRKA
jgi:hypothetical protein